MIQVHDSALSHVEQYRESALRQTFGTVKAGAFEFHGISVATELALPQLVTLLLPGATPTLSFFRKSPHGQAEPNYIHSDAEMGEWTAILYLNPQPPDGDGTCFWRHRSTGATSGTFDDAVRDANVAADWELWRHVGAKFNRLLIFQSDQFHSRALRENYGVDDDARLIQVVFGTGGTWKESR